MDDEQQPEDDATGRTRNSAGAFIRTPDQVTEDARAAELRGQGWTYPAIAREMGISKSTAHDRVHRAFRDILREPAEQARAVELARLEEAHDHAMAVLLREHITISHGKVITVKDDDGNDVPLIDDAPVLAAIDRIDKLSASRRRLLGLDAPARTENTVTVTPQDSELRDMLRQARERVAAEEQQLLDGDAEA